MSEVNYNIAMNTPAPITIYTPQEVVRIFREQLQTPKRVVSIEGIYLLNPKSANYNGYFYDILRAQNDNYEMTLVVPVAIREKLKDGTLVQLSGVVSKELKNKCCIELHFHVTKYQIIEEDVISEDEQKLILLQAKKSAKGFKNIDGILESKLFRGERPTICLLFARGTITDIDFNKGLESARSHINFIEENETFTQISQLKMKLAQIDKAGYDLIAIVRGGGSGIREVFNMPELIEAVVNLSTPLATGVGHPGENPFIAKVADKDLSTPSLLGVYFKDLVNRVIAQREKSKAILVEQVKKQYEERINVSEKQNKELNEKITLLTKASEASQEMSKKQNKELQDRIAELNKNIANAQIIHSKDLREQQNSYEKQLKNQNENISKMQMTIASLQKSLTDTVAQNTKNAKELVEARNLVITLENQLKQSQNNDSTKYIVIGIIILLIILICISL